MALSNARKFPVIIPAAGIGSRMASVTAKQYLQIGQKTILEHTLDIFLSHKDISLVIVAIHPLDTNFHGLNIAKHPKIVTVLGGDERVDSVLAGIDFLCSKKANIDTNSLVLVHDAARPCLALNDLSNLLKQANTLGTSDNTNKNYACGAILAVPVTDTIKLATVNKKKDNESYQSISKTIDRKQLWQAQTPQMFNIEQLRTAIIRAQKKNQIITDEASAIELLGGNVKLIEGQSSNIKITRPSDLVLADFYLSKTSAADSSGQNNCS